MRVRVPPVFAFASPTNRHESRLSEVCLGAERQRAVVVLVWSQLEYVRHWRAVPEVQHGVEGHAVPRVPALVTSSRLVP